jgi:hypothetical protein
MRYVIFIASIGFAAIVFQNCAYDFIPLSDSISLGSDGGSSLASLQTLKDVTKTCDDMGEDSDVSPLRRLSTGEYIESIRDAFQCQFNCYNLYRNDLETLFKQLPIESSQDSIATYIRFTNLDQSMTPDRLTGYHKIALFLSTYFADVSHKSTAQYLFDSCASVAAPDATCVDKLVSGLVLRLFRRPISTQQVGEFQAVMGAGAWNERFGRAVYYALMAPEFLYHFQVDGPASNGVVELDQYAVAEKISYLIRGHAPDSALLLKAKNGELGTPEQIKDAIEAMKTAYPTQVRDQFWKFIREWLAVPQAAFLIEPRLVAAAEGAFDATNQTVNSAVRTGMNQELRDMFEYYVFTTPGTYSDLLLNQKSFARDATVASLYGAPVWDGVSVPPDHAANERSGFLTTAALITRGGAYHNPFRTGGLVFKHILCRHFEDDTEPLLQPPLDPNDEAALMTTRERFEKMVPRAATSCMSCHTSVEGFGMPFQDYDLFGRHRHGVEKVYSSAGVSLGQKAIDPSKTVVIDSAPVTVTSAVDTIRRIEKSTEAHTCFAREYIRFANSREEQRRDACPIKRLTENLETMSVWDAIKNYVADQAFAKRRYQ